MERSDESGFFNPDQLNNTKTGHDGYHDFKLLYTSTKGVCRVFTAHRLGKIFIVKTPKEEYKNEPAAIALLRKEFDIAFAIDSPHTVRTYDFLQLPQLGQSIIYEYITGQTLRSLIESGSILTTTLTDCIVRSIGIALSHIHASGAAHLDLKPENIMVNPTTGMLKVIDFGFADSEEFYLFRNVGGTPRYSPPAADSASATDKDLYAFGVILSELLPLVPSSRQKPVSQLSKKLISGTLTDAASILQIYATLLRRRKRLLLTGSLILAGILLTAVALTFLTSEPPETSVRTQPSTPPAGNVPDSVTPVIAESPADTQVQPLSIPAKPAIQDAKPDQPQQPQPQQTHPVSTFIPLSPDDTAKNSYGVSLAEAKYYNIFSHNEFDKYVVHLTDKVIIDLVNTFQNYALPYPTRSNAYATYRSQKKVTEIVATKTASKFPQGDINRARGLASQRWTIYYNPAMPDTLNR